MEHSRLRAFLAAALFSFAAPAAWAQGGHNYDVKTMNFDLWCQETAHLPAERCDKRTPEDEKTFEAFRNQIEEYEIPYLQEKSKAVQLDTDILHNDPVDHSNGQGQQNQTPPPNR